MLSIKVWELADAIQNMKFICHNSVFAICDRNFYIQTTRFVLVLSVSMGLGVFGNYGQMLLIGFSGLC